MSAYETLEILKDEGGWAEVVFNRPDVLNALNLQMVTDLTAALSELEQDADVRGLIFRGAGDRAFIAGADISELVERKCEDAFRAINAGLFQKIEDFPRPTIAAIGGYCLGGGSELALACDIRIGAEDAVMGQPEVKLGIIPGAGAPHRLTRTVGTGLARELIFTGRLVEADECVRIGLLNRVVANDALLDDARGTMRSILKNSDLAVRLAKIALNAACNSVDRRHMMLECVSQGITFDSDDKRQRMARFLERKKQKEQNANGGGEA
ncbi:MAG: enoyl-CoA hydratase [Planctomycetes bacterium]|nr:enoyl-CoA hydratase [Planctomycetota bacterium]